MQKFKAYRTFQEDHNITSRFVEMTPEELDPGEDDGEGIPQLVGDTCGQPGQRCSFLSQQTGRESPRFVAGRGAARNRLNSHETILAAQPPTRPTNS